MTWSHKWSGAKKQIQHTWHTNARGSQRWALLRAEAKYLVCYCTRAVLYLIYQLWIYFYFMYQCLRRHWSRNKSNSMAGLGIQLVFHVSLWQQNVNNVASRELTVLVCLCIVCKAHHAWCLLGGSVYYRKAILGNYHIAQNFDSGKVWQNLTNETCQKVWQAKLWRIELGLFVLVK